LVRRFDQREFVRVRCWQRTSHTIAGREASFHTAANAFSRDVRRCVRRRRRDSGCHPHSRVQGRCRITNQQRHINKQRSKPTRVACRNASKFIGGNHAAGRNANPTGALSALVTFQGIRAMKQAEPGYAGCRMGRAFGGTSRQVDGCVRGAAVCPPLDGIPPILFICHRPFCLSPRHVIGDDTAIAKKTKCRSLLKLRHFNYCDFHE
jgi:hypothetical protein